MMSEIKPNLSPGNAEWMRTMDVHNKKTVLVFLAEALAEIAAQEGIIKDLQDRNLRLREMLPNS